MHWVWVVGVNFLRTPHDRSNVVMAVWEINIILAKYGYPFRLRESMRQIQLPDGSSRADVLRWKTEHMPTSSVMIISRGIGIVSSARHCLTSMMNGDILDHLERTMSPCRRLWGWHWKDCKRHQAMGLMLHEVGHIVGLEHINKGFMKSDGHLHFPRIHKTTFPRLKSYAA